MISPWLNMAEAAAWLRFVRPDGTADLRAALKWVDAHRVPSVKRGRAVLVRREDLDAALQSRRAS